MNVRFTGDPKKDKANQRKHGFSFKQGEQAFNDPFARFAEDCEDPNGEMTYHAIGRIESQELVLVVYVDRSTDEQEIIHIVSVRKAEDYEQRAYADQF